jgi:hypothetical protein
MPYLLMYQEHDDYEILGLYETRELAEEGKLRAIERNIQRLDSVLEEGRKLSEEGYDFWDEEDLEWHTAFHERAKESYPWYLNIFPIEYGDSKGE